MIISMRLCCTTEVTDELMYHILISYSVCCHSKICLYQWHLPISCQLWEPMVHGWLFDSILWGEPHTNVRRAKKVDLLMASCCAIRIPISIHKLKYMLYIYRLLTNTSTSFSTNVNIPYKKTQAICGHVLH